MALKKVIKKYFFCVQIKSINQILYNYYYYQRAMQADKEETYPFFSTQIFKKIVDGALSLTPKGQCLEDVDQHKKNLYLIFFQNSQPSKFKNIKQYLDSSLSFQKGKIDKIITKYFDSFCKIRQQAKNKHQLLIKELKRLKTANGQQTIEYLIRAKILNYHQKLYKDFLQNLQQGQWSLVDTKKILAQAQKEGIYSKYSKRIRQIEESKNQSLQKKLTYWDNILESIQILQVGLINQLLTQYTQNLQINQTDQLTMVVGVSGVGKTTFCTYMGRNQLEKIKSNGQTYYQAKDIEIRQKLKISHQNSETTIPNIVSYNGFIYIDCGGFNDGRNQQIDILNNLINKKLATTIKAMKIVVLISQKILGERLAGLKAFAETISNFFQNYTKAQKGITYVFNKFNNGLDNFKESVNQIVKDMPKVAQTNQTNQTNYQKFFKHLNQKLTKNVYVQFDPENDQQDQIEQKIKGNSKNIQSIADIIQTSFSTKSKQKIRKRAQYLKEAIQSTYLSKEFKKTIFYLNQLQLLQQLQPNEQKQKIISSPFRIEDQIKFINYQNSKNSQKYQNELKYFFLSNEDSDLQKLKTTEKEIDQMKSFKYDKIQSSKKQIDKVINEAIKRIKQCYFDTQSKDLKKQQKPKNLTQIKAQLRFLQYKQKQSYNQIVKNAKSIIQSKKRKFFTMLDDQTNYDVIRFKSFYKELINISMVSNLAQENRQQNLKPTSLNYWIKQYIERENKQLQQIIQFAKKDNIQEDSFKMIKHFIQRIQCLFQMDYSIQILFQKQKHTYIQKISLLIQFYADAHNLQKVDDANNLKMIKIYQKNYNQLMKIPQINKQNRIFKNRFNLNVDQYINKQKENLQTLIAQINSEVDKNRKDAQINSDKVKISFQNIAKILQFLNKAYTEENLTQYIKKQSLQEVIQQSDKIIQRFVNKIQSRTNINKIVDYRVNYSLLTDYILVQQLLTKAKSIDSHKKAKQNKIQIENNLNTIKASIILKLKMPLQIVQKQITYIQSLKSQPNNEKMVNKSIYTMLKKLLNYFKLNKQKVDQLSISSSGSTQALQTLFQADKLSIIIKKLTKMLNQQFNRLKTYFKHESFYKQQKDKINEGNFNYDRRKQSISYIQCFNQMKYICQNFELFQEIKNYEKVSSKFDLQKYIKQRIEQISGDLRKGELKQYEKLSQVQKQFANLKEIFKKISSQNQGKSTQIDQIHKQLNQNLKSIKLNFNQDIQSIRNKLKQKIIDLQLLKQLSEFQCIKTEPQSKNQLLKAIKNIEDFIKYQLNDKYTRQQSNSKEIIQFILNIKQFQTLTASIPLNYKVVFNQSDQKLINIFQQFLFKQFDQKIQIAIKESKRDIFVQQNKWKDLIKTQRQFKKILSWNQQQVLHANNVRTILALDGTGSMGHLFANIKQIISETFKRLFAILQQKKVNKGFQICLIIYRNYSSIPGLIIQSSDFQTKPQQLKNFLKGINVSGGMGNQAIQVCFNHVNQLLHVSQIVIIGDARSNQIHQTKERRSRYAQNVKQLPQTDIEKETKQLINRKIPVHSYYIADDAYFRELSSQTFGIAEKFDVNSRLAVDNLTNFLSSRILQKVDTTGDLVRFYQKRYMSK